jgi:hypothetical protein
LLAMAADIRLLNAQAHDPGAQNDAGLSDWEGCDAPLATLLRNLRHVVEERTVLLRDLTRLVQELEEATKPGEDQKEKKEARLLEGQIRARKPDMVLASELQRAVVSSPAEKRIGEVDDLITKADGNVAGVVVGIRDENGRGKSIALKLELFEVTPEPGGRTVVTLNAKSDNLQLAPDFKPKAEQKRDTPDRANVWRPRWPCLGPPVVAPCLGQSALFLARTVRLIFGPGWMVPTAASCMVLLTTIATLSHFSRVCTRITGAWGRWTHAADGRALIDSKGVTPSASAADFDER